jgi:hypothetical protein
MRFGGLCVIERLEIYLLKKREKKKSTRMTRGVKRVEHSLKGEIVGRENDNFRCL